MFTTTATTTGASMTHNEMVSIIREWDMSGAQDVEGMHRLAVSGLRLTSEAACTLITLALSR